MNILEIIDKKRLNKSLNENEIQFVIENYVNGNIKDYQMSSLLMAIVINGMNFDETYYFTKYMINSGKIIDLSSINGIKVDKHSTGGVGDKITLIIAPIVSLYAKFVKMSGRGLGFTGGTIDKLESIKGFNVNYDIDEIINQVNKYNICISYTSDELVIADKKIYALRDASGTVASIPLIASSIMSKKIASGADDIVIDLKVGAGAFMKNKEDALTLAHTMINIGKKFNKKVVCILSNMNDVLGISVGNKLEVLESIEVLKNGGEEDIRNLAIEISSRMISIANNIDIEKAKEKVVKSLEDGSAYNKFLEFVKIQGGDISSLVIDAKTIYIKAYESGYIKYIDVEGIGEFSRSLGAGRINKDDIIDNNVGIKIFKKCGDYIEKDDIIAQVFYNKDVPNIVDKVNSFFTLTNNKVDKNEIILDIVE